MKAQFTIHAAKSITIYFGIEIEISRDGSSVRYRKANYIPADEKNKYGHVSHWQDIKYDNERPYFIYHGGREYLDEYMKVD